MTGRKAYRTIEEGGFSEVVEKKSRFLGESRHVETEEDALAFVEEVRKKYYDARHHCYAWIIGRDQSLIRSSDDGEPQGTAGRPILAVLQGEELTNAAIVVTRYFGGTLLGTGGLVRCYGAAAREALEGSTLVEKRPGVLARLKTNYSDSGRAAYLLSENGIPVLGTEYEADVTYRIILPDESADAFLKKIAESTGGRAACEKEGTVFYSPDGNQFRYERISQ